MGGELRGGLLKEEYIKALQTQESFVTNLILVERFSKMMDLASGLAKYR